MSRARKAVSCSRSARPGHRLAFEPLEHRLAPAGHTFATADALALGPTGGAFAGGTITSPDSPDLYRISLAAGDRLTTEVTARAAGSGLDSVLRVFDGSGGPVAANLQTGGDARLAFQAAATGTYFVGVQAAGASAGTYSLAVDVNPGQPLLADLAGSSFRLAEPTAAWGETVRPTFAVGNRGGAASGAFRVQLYLSRDARIDPADSLPLLAAPLEVSGLAAGAEWSPSGLEVALPTRAAAEAAGFATSGRVYVGLRITPADPARDAGAADKGGVHAGTDWAPLAVVTPVATAAADLAQIDPALNLRVTGTAGEPTRYTFTVGATPGVLAVRVEAVGGGPLPTVSLSGGAGGDTLLATSSAAPRAATAALTQHVTPGTYVLSVAGAPGGFRLTTTLTPGADPVQPLPTGPNPVAPVVADFTNSGRLDVAVVSRGDATSGPGVQILLANGDGTFRTGPTLPTAGVPTAVTAADLNGDGRADLATAGADGTVGVYLGNGDGTFRPPVVYDAGSGLVAIAAADLTGTGVKDLVVASADAQAVGVLRGTGDGTFRPARAVPLGATPTDVAVADLTGDGVLDVAVATEGTAAAPGGVRILTGDGRGGFGATIALAADPAPRFVSVADMNADGRPDLVAAGAAVAVYFGHGDGSFGPRLSAPAGPAPAGLAVADLNGDGTIDVLAPSATDSALGVLLNPGTGALEAGPAVSLRARVAGVVVADLDGDGAADLVAADAGTGVTALWGNGDGSFRTPPLLQTGNTPVALASADFNGDGHPDVAAATADDGRVGVAVGNGDGTYLPPTSVPVGARPVALAAADLNNDGKADLAVANFADGTVTVLLGDGDGTFRPPLTYAVGTGPVALVAADVNGDGNADLAVANNGDDTVQLLLGAGDGTFRAAPAFRVGTGAPAGRVGTAPGAGPVALAVADVDGGAPDLVVSDTLDDTVGVFLGAGDGTFRPGPRIATATPPGAVQVADTTGDGTPDIVVLSPATSTVNVLPGAGDGTFGPRRIYGVGRGPAVAATADLNGDRFPDLVVTNALDGTASVLLGDGAGNFQNQRTFAVGQAPRGVAITDANVDGRPDVVVANSGENTLTALLGRGDGTFAAATQANSVGATNTPFAADLDGDGVADSVTRSGAGDVLFRRGRGDDRFAPPLTLNPGRPARDIAVVRTATGWAVAATDERPDPALSAPGRPVFAVSLYAVDGGGAATRALAFSSPLQPVRVAAADLNGDGRGDVAVTNPLDNSVQVAFQTAAGGFGPLATLPVGDTPVSAALADVNADGRADVVVGNLVSGDLSVFLTRADGTFAPAGRVRASAAAVSVQTAAVVTTAAGNKFQSYFGDGGPATTALLSTPAGVTVDAAGNQYIADFANNVVRKVIAATGRIVTVAGTGSVGYSGDGGPATTALLNNPTGVALDAAGNLYIADLANRVVRRVDAGTGVITTVAGNFAAGPGYSGDGGPATAARFNSPVCVAVDAAGTLYVSDLRGNVVRKVDPATGVITTVAGTGTGGFSGDGGPAAAAQLNTPQGIAVDRAGNLFIADAVNRVVRQVTPAGTIRTVPGTVSRFLLHPTGVAVDAGGDLYVVDGASRSVLKTRVGTGELTLYAGSGRAGFSGDGGPATRAQFFVPQSIGLDAAGNLFVADTGNNVIRRVDAATGTISTVAGAIHVLPLGADGGAPTAAFLNTPGTTVVDARGNVYVQDSGNNVVRVIDAVTGRIRVVAGTGVAGYSGDGGPATAARLSNPIGMAVDRAGNLYIADTYNDVVRKVEAGTGVITTFAGTGVSGYSGDGGPAAAAQLSGPQALAVDRAGNLLIADSNNSVVRRVDAATGVITTVVGTGDIGYAGDGGPAADAVLLFPAGVATDPADNVYVSDSYNNVVRKVDAATGVITTIAGTGRGGYAGDGGPATAALFSAPQEVAADARGNVYIADFLNHAIRKVDAVTGVVTTIAGTGDLGFAGDGGPGAAARLSFPEAVTLDAAGNVYISDSYNNVVRKVSVPRSAVVSPAQLVSLAVADFTGDGTNDVLAVNRGTHAAAVLPGAGDGTFGPPRAELATPLRDGLAVGAQPGAVVAADFHTADGLDATRAGKTDLAVLMQDRGEVWVFTNAGDGSFRHTRSVAVGDGATGLSLAPGAAPGRFNLLVGNRAGDVLTLVGDGRGSFDLLTLTGNRTPIQVTNLGTGPAVALVANQRTNRVTVQAPTTAPPLPVGAPPLPSSGGAYTPVASLAAENPTAQLAPGGVTWATIDSGAPLPSAIVVASGSNQLLVYRTVSGDPTRPVFADPVGYETGTNPVGVTVADINGDRIPDMLVPNQGSNDVSVLFGGYDAAGLWVGTAGPRLRSAGAGPMAVALVDAPASPGGRDLVVSNQDGTVSVLPGRGLGFFDDRAPATTALGSALMQPPAFVGGSGVGFAVTAGGALVRFDLGAPGGGVSVVTAAGVMAAQPLADGRVVEVRAGGVVDVLAADGGPGQALLPRGGWPDAPSGIAVVGEGDALEVLVTSQGSDTVFAFTTAPDVSEVLPFDPQNEFTAIDNPLAVVSTLVTGLSDPGGGSSSGPADPTDPASFGSPAGALFAAATGLADAATFGRAAALGDDEVISAAGNSFALALIVAGTGSAADEADAEPAEPPADLQDFVTGTAAGLRRLIDAARGNKVEGEAGAKPEAEWPLPRLLEAVRDLPADSPPSASPAAPLPSPERGKPAPQPRDGERADGAAPQPPLADGAVVAAGEPEAAEPEAASPAWLIALLPALLGGRASFARKSRSKPRAGAAEGNEERPPAAELLWPADPL